MIQILIALFLLGGGGLDFRRAILEEGLDASMARVVASGSLAIVGFMFTVIILISLCGTHLGVDSDLAKYEQIKIAVKSARAGDPSYSGILLEAVQWNQTIAISRKRKNSLWWGFYYSDKIADLDLIEMPGEKR